MGAWFNIRMRRDMGRGHGMAFQRAIHMGSLVFPATGSLLAVWSTKSFGIFEERNDTNMHAYSTASIF